MRTNARVIEILLAGPADTESQLKIIRDEISRWNAAHSRTENSFLEAVNWKSHSYPDTGKRPQALLNRQIVDGCDLVVAVFWKTLGSPTGKAQSGTIEELERLQKAKKTVMIYFSEAPIPQSTSMASLRRVKAYRASLNRTLYSTFISHTDFRKQFSVHLPKVIHKLLGKRPAQKTAPTFIPSTYLKKRLARLRRIRMECESTSIVNDLPKVIAKLKPLLLDVVEHSRVSKIKEVRDYFQFLISRTAELEDFAIRSARDWGGFSNELDEFFQMLEEAFATVETLEKLSEWDLARLPDLRVKRLKDTSELAWNWPEEQQCGCASCKDYRRLLKTMKADINSDFRSYATGFLKAFANISTDPGSGWEWVLAQSRVFSRFGTRFRLDGQSENAALAGRLMKALTPFEDQDLAARLCSSPVDLAGPYGDLKSASAELRSVLGSWPLELS